MKTTLVLILAACTAAAAIRTIREPLEMLPAHDEAPTLAELTERAALRAARIERAKALAELAADIGEGTATNSVAVSNEVARIRAKAVALKTFGAVLSDTRTNIAQTAELSDIDIARLYLRQTRKTSRELETIAPTNTIEYLIGAGMRQDIANTTNTTEEIKK